MSTPTGSGRSVCLGSPVDFTVKMEIYNLQSCGKAFTGRIYRLRNGLCRYTLICRDATMTERISRNTARASLGICSAGSMWWNSTITAICHG